MSPKMLAPIVALAAWTMVVWAWMYATRLPAILRSKMVLDREAPRGEQMAQLPARVRWKADNYNHLMEQPTVFYAVALALSGLAGSGEVEVALAWVYVALRVVHSVVQATVNVIQLRFALFSLSSLVLVALIVRAGLLLAG
jgi:hypothetical protein